VVRQDKAILAMADKFVFLRIIRMNDVDLSQFRYDYDLTWMSFFLNADGRIYTRYGGRTAESAESRLSRDGLLHTMNEVLRLHKDEDGKKPAPRPPEPKPVKDLTMIAGMLKVRPNNCVHCHQVNEALNVEARAQKEEPKLELRKSSFFAFPPPETIGLTPELIRGNYVQEVKEGSPADKAGLKKGDVVRMVQGQSVLTTFDIQYGLNEVGADNKLTLTAERDGKAKEYELQLPAGWKRWDASWRKSLHAVQPFLGYGGRELSAEERDNLKIKKEELGYEIRYVQPNGILARAGLQVEDVIVALDGKRRLPYRFFRGIIPLEHSVGDQIELTVLRKGKEEKLTFKWQ
jgi:hypothetical protein